MTSLLTRIFTKSSTVKPEYKEQGKFAIYKFDFIFIFYIASIETNHTKSVPQVSAIPIDITPKKTRPKFFLSSSQEEVISHFPASKKRDSAVTLVEKDSAAILYKNTKQNAKRQPLNKDQIASAKFFHKSSSSASLSSFTNSPRNNSGSSINTMSSGKSVSFNSTMSVIVYDGAETIKGICSSTPPLTAPYNKGVIKTLEIHKC